MSQIKEIINSKINYIRDNYDLNNKCGRSLFSIVQEIELKNGERIDLFRIPFKEQNIAGFIGYKNERFVIFTNTNKNLGYEVFTLAHELYHILENNNLIKEEIAVLEDTSLSIDSDEMADMFAAELLMPEMHLKKEVKKFLNNSSENKITPAFVVKLQQDYYVEYKAMTKRLKEIGLIDCEKEKELNDIAQTDALILLTKRLGYDNSLNEKSGVISLPSKYLLALEENRKLNKIDYDELHVIFSYCDKAPEYFGYYKEDLLSDEDISFMNKLTEELR